MSQDVQEIPVERPGFGEIVVLSSTSTRVASIVSGHGILIWNIATGKIQSHVLLSHPVNDQELFFSLDGTQVTCDVSDRELCTWDTITGRLHKTLEKPPGFLRCLAYSPDGIHIAHHSLEANILLWNTLSGHGKRLESYSYSENPPVFSPNGKKVACRTNDGSIKVWDVLTGSLQQSFLSDAMELAFSPSGKLMISLTYGAQIDLWDVEVLSAEQIDSVDLRAEDVAFSHDGKSIVCCTSQEDFFTIVDAKTGITQRKISVPADINGHIKIARFLPGDENIVIVLNRSVMIWEAATDTFQWQRDDNVDDIASSPNGEYLAGIVDSGEIRIWNIRTRALTMTIKDQRWDFGALAFSPNGKQIASYAYDMDGDSMALMIWDISRPLRASKFLGNAISSHIPYKKPKNINLGSDFASNSLKFSADGQYFLSDEGPIMASSTHAQTEDKKMPGNQPSHLHFGSGDDSGWICWRGQPFFRVPLSLMVFLGHDVRDEKIVIRYRERGSRLLILDIDTAILSTVLESTGSTYQGASPFLNR
jgi:WD40 repeat protein